MTGQRTSARSWWVAGFTSLVLWLGAGFTPHARAQDDDLGDLADLDSPPPRKKEAEGGKGKGKAKGKAKGKGKAAAAAAAAEPEPAPTPAPAPPPPVAAPAPVVTETAAEPEDEPETEAPPSAAESDAAAATSDEAPPTAAPKPEEDLGPTVVIQPYAGFGIATRSFQRPVVTGSQSLSSSVVPAAEAGLSVYLWPHADFSLAINLAYQSALGFTITERPPFALENEVRARSERVQLEVAPGWRVGPVRLSVPIGASMRTLWPEVHTLMTPGYSLLGPHARLELSTVLGGPVTVRIAPEAQWIVHIDQMLRDQGVSSSGVALGGDVTFGVNLGIFNVGLNYRESHALITTTRGFTFTDVERYFTLRLAGNF